MKRGVATITVYVYGETDQELKKDATRFKESLNVFENHCEAEIEQLHEVPFGKIGEPRKIEL